MKYYHANIAGKVIGFARVPKNGGTSAARMLLFANGKIADQAELAEIGRRTNIAAPDRKPGDTFHDDRMLQVANVPTGESWAFIRDPMERFVSGYTNRILHHRKADREVPFVEFVARFDHFIRKNSDLAHHFAPQSASLGNDPAIFSHVVMMDSGIEAFRRRLSELAGFEMPTVHHQTGGSDRKREITITDEARELVAKVYAEDRVWVEATVAIVLQ